MAYNIARLLQDRTFIKQYTLVGIKLITEGGARTHENIEVQLDALYALYSTLVSQNGQDAVSKVHRRLTAKLDREYGHPPLPRRRDNDD